MNCAECISYLLEYHAVLHIMGYAEEVDFLVLPEETVELLTQIVPVVYPKMQH